MGHVVVVADCLAWQVDVMISNVTDGLGERIETLAVVADTWVR